MQSLEHTLRLQYTFLCNRISNNKKIDMVRLLTYVILCIEFQPEFFPDQEKKTYSLECHSRNGGCNHFHQTQPDLTRTVVVVPSCYEYPFTNDQNAYSLTRSCSEHHYDVPHHNGGGGSSTVTTATMAPPVPSVAPDSPNALSSSPESSHSLTSYTCSSKYCYAIPTHHDQQP